jgi:DNA-binding XRE family transcriptional regulator
MGQRGIALTALGKQTGIPWEQIGTYERGKVRPTWETIAKLIRVFGVEVAGCQVTSSRRAFGIGLTKVC